MKQIKSNQIVSEPTKASPYSALPRDLSSVTSNSVDVQGQTAEPTATAVTAPETPAIVEIVSQTVRWSDGRAVIDVVLNVDDNNYDYELRITKSEGNL